jgi:flagellar assembly protein FliH
MIIKSTGNQYKNEIYKLKPRPVPESYSYNNEKENTDVSNENGDEINAKEGKVLIEKAMEEARQIKAEAYKQGMGEGHGEGYEKGYQEALKSFERELSMMEKIKVELENYRGEILKMSEREVVRLAISISEKIVRRKIAEDDKIVIDSVKFALKSIPHLDKVIINLNPEDYDYITSKKDEIKDIIARYREIKFVDDRRIEKGGCVIETEIGNIDTQVSNQLKKISSEIMEEAIKK